MTRGFGNWDSAKWGIIENPRVGETYMYYVPIAATLTVCESWQMQSALSLITASHLTTCEPVGIVMSAL